MIRLAVFASGGGTNFQSLIEGLDGRYAEIEVLIASKEGIYAIERAKKANIPYAVVGKEQYEDIDERFQAIDAVLTEKAVDGIILAGYLTVLPAWFIEKYRNRIVNIHPAYLPRHGGVGCYGMRVHRAVVENQEDYSGVTVHLVTEKVDGGAILSQEKYPVYPWDSPESVAEKGHVVEQYIYKNTVNVWVKTLTERKER